MAAAPIVLVRVSDLIVYFWAADGYSIYVKGLPSNANHFLLENEFKKFGPIKSGGIQVRTQRVFYLSIFMLYHQSVSFFWLLMNGLNRVFLLALWSLKWQVLCKKQLRYLLDFAVNLSSYVKCK